MKFRTKCIFAVVVFMIVTIVVLVLSYMADRSPVALLNEESYFDEFYVQEDEEFLVPANSKKEYQVSFIGAFGGKEQKVDRELPPIKVIMADSKTSDEGE